MARLVGSIELKPPFLHDRQIPNVLPLPMMLAQRLVIEANSAALIVLGRNGVSVVANAAGDLVPFTNFVTIAAPLISVRLRNLSHLDAHAAAGDRHPT